MEFNVFLNNINRISTVFKTERKTGIFPRGSMMRSKVKPADSISILSNSGKNREMKKHEGKRSNFEVGARGLHPPQDKMFLAGC